MNYTDTMVDITGINFAGINMISSYLILSDDLVEIVIVVVPGI